jgi:multidrug efflux pump subunit AcrA (membrane-fusion protein)
MAFRPKVGCPLSAWVSSSKASRLRGPLAIFYLSMKLFFLLLLALAVGTGLRYCWDSWTPQPASAPVQAVREPPALGALLGVGTVLTSHSFPLALYRHGPIKHLYAEDGQHVHKGDLLLKYYDYTFLMAPTAGIVTQFFTSARDQQSQGEPVFFFTEVEPFRLRLPAGPADDTLAVGQRVQVQSMQHPAQVVTGVILAILPDSAALLLDLRLLTVGHEPLPAQAQVRVTRLPNLATAPPRQVAISANYSLVPVGRYTSLTRI